MGARILVVDDEPDIRVLLKDILEDEGYEVDVAEHARAANEIRRELAPDLVLLDIWMPEVDGVTLLKQWKSSGDDRCPVVMMSGHGTVETAVEATRYGAVDFVEKPLSMAKLLSTVKSALAGSGAAAEHRPQREIPVGTSRIVQQLKQQMNALRESAEAVFFSGAHGSGRKIWAEYLCADSGGMDVLEPGANIRRLTPLRRNLYIEEVADLSPAQQADLYEAVMSCDRRSGPRFIVASRQGWKDLEANPAIDPRLAGLWRDAIAIPSLDEHIEDIPELLEYYVNWYSDNEQLPYRHFDVAAQNLLRNRHWSGDINQLKLFIRAILTNGDAEEIGLDEIRRVLRQFDTEVDGETETGDKMQITIDMNLELREAREAFEREYLSRQLAASGNNMTELARRVGQERTHLYRKLKSLGLQTKKQ